MTNIEEVNKDLEELQRLLTADITRPRVRACLSNEIEKVQKEIDQLQKRTTTAASSNNITPSAAAATNILPTTKITTYAWDQSEKFLKLYVNVAGSEPGQQQDDRVKLDGNTKSVDFRANDIAGKNYEFSIKGLLHPIVPDESSFKPKKDQILLMLKKKDVGKTWDSVTETEQQDKDKQKSKFDSSKDEDPNSGLMTLMKQMYDDGDDDMKRTIKKAWFEAQEKKKGGPGGGDGGMIDLPSLPR